MMKNKIDQAITRKLDKNFDKKFWNKFDSKFSKKSSSEESWQRLFAPLAIATVLIVLTINLYSGGEKYSQKELAEFMIEIDEIEALIDSSSNELDIEYYAFTD